MAFVPNVNWTNDEPPGFEADEMIRMQLGIADAHTIAQNAATVGLQAALDASEASTAAAAAQATADEALDLAGTGGVQTVDGDVARIYRAGTTPPDGAQPGDLVVSEYHPVPGPGSLPGLVTWVDASATGARDLGSVLPDVSGTGDNLERRTETGVIPASVDRLNGLPAFRFENSAYWNPGSRTGARTLSGVFAFTGGIPASVDQTFMFTGGTLALDLGTRAGTGRLFLTVEGTTVYNLPMSWSADGKAYVSFVISLGTEPALYLDGALVTTTVPTLTTGGDRGSLVFSRLTDGFVGVLGEFAEHEGIAVDSSQAAQLAAYYREKWRI